MSWDNVKGVSAARIWTDNPDTTQAYLFANGNHQVKLTVGLSLVLANTTQPGPTEDEVKAALSLIDFNTGAGISHLKTGDKGEYGYVYLPNMPEQIKALPVSDASNPGAYQYELDYYLSSDSTVNANYASETVALLLSYTDVNGNKIHYQTGSGSNSQSYVAVTVYPPKKYGVAGSSSTPVIIEIKDDQPQCSYSYSTPLQNLAVHTCNLRIDDGYFRIIKFQADSGTESNNPFYRHGTNVAPGGIAYDETWETNEGFLPVENKLNQGRVSYKSTLSIIYDDENRYFFNITVPVEQEANEIIFIHFYAIINPPDDTGFDNKIDTASLSALDQFGNKFYIEVGKTNDGFQINSIT
ncbi:hypothetical protein [Pseudescherichia sp.]|uniref:hypothetical protein n=1 Tax=Pseudescherichia sp. TaxID=2055881 RepID=UPI002897562D|nr:hypothetical protein [Pseudescherichia sp.]